MKKLSLFFVAAFLLSMTAYAGLDCDNITVCKFSRAGTVCENIECPAIKFRLGQALTLRIIGALYAMPTCQGSGQDFDFTVEQPAGDALLYLEVPACPAGAPY